MEDILVVKIGGAEGVDPRPATDDVVRLVQAGQPVVVVHGGSGEANRLGQALGHPARFVTSASGHTSRLTDAKALEVFTMATALINRRIVAQLQAAGVNAMGLSGLDGRVVEAERKRALRIVEDGRTRIVRDDLTGKPRHVNASLLRRLLEMGYTPVLAPLALGEGGQPLNVDGDRVAALVAQELGAETLVFLTGVPGLMRDFPDESTLVSHVPAEELGRAMDWAQGRMKKKVLGAREALAGGVRRAVFASSSGEHPVRDALAGRGTVLGEPFERDGHCAPDVGIDETTVGFAKSKHERAPREGVHSGT